MAWKFDGDRPIYAQLVEQIQFQIIAGAYPPGSRLPAVRELAAEAAVNPNTMQKALTELEEAGLIFAQRTAGRFVTEDQQTIERMKQGLSHEMIERFLKDMRHLGCGPQQSVEILRKYTEGLQ